MVTRFVDFERDKLFDEVWEHPVSHLAQQYGVSDANLRLAAREMGLPLPASGHWSKVAHGKGAAKPELPDTEGPATYRLTWYVNDEVEEMARRFEPRFSELKKPAADMPPMATALGECIPLIRQMATRLKKGFKDGREWPAVKGGGLFELAVAPENQLRALLTMDRLVRYCKASGLKLVTDDKAQAPAHFLVDGTKLTMRIFESGRREDNEVTPAELLNARSDPYALRHRQKYVYRATNLLKLEVQVPDWRWTEFTVQDGSETPLAERLAEVPARMQEVALRIRLRDEIRTEERDQAETRRAALARQEALKAAELAKLAKFEGLADRLERAGRLRVLTAALQASKVFPEDSEVRELTWLRTAADWLDPTVQVHWPVVDDAHVLA